MEELAQSSTPDELAGLIGRVQTYNPQADIGLIRRAYDYSARMHLDQKRESGEPYVTHPLNVAMIIAQLKLDVPSIVTGLLHDVVEDTHASLAEVQTDFGPEVAQLVDGVTKVSKITFQSREEKQAENFRKMIIAMANDIRVVLIKLADRLHNMRTLDHLSADRQQEIARETMEIYAPIAHRLGIYWLKSELEDLSFRYLNSSAYQTLKAFVAAKRKEREEYIANVIEILSRRMSDSGVTAEVTGRPKHFFSIHSKMQELGLSFEEIYDLVAFRIIVDTVRECYEALGVVHANWKPVPGRFKDYIALPKANMYQSLHTTVIGPRGQRMEVQIRTREMHKVAEEGIAAHWSYKDGNSKEIKEKDTERFAWLRRLIEWQQNLKDPQEFLSTVKDDLFPEEVFVFTPKGDVFDFPLGSTVIDFAYRIHSQVGNHLAGARVNGRMVPLRYRLRSGDTVEVLTSEKQVPGKDWTNYAATARAKSRIRQWLRNQQAERSRDLGISLIDRELEPVKLSVTQTQIEQAARRSPGGIFAARRRWPARGGGLRNNHASPVAREAAYAGRAEDLSSRETADAAGARAARTRCQGSAQVSQRRGRGVGRRRHAGAIREVLQPAAGRGDHRLHHARARRHGARRGMPACAQHRSAAARARGVEGRRGSAAPDSARSAVCRSAGPARRDDQGDRVGGREYIDGRSEDPRR